MSVFLSYLLGYLSTSRRDKIEAYDQRYNVFYVPFLTKLCGGFLWEVDHSKDRTVRNEFFDLIMSNTAYLGKESARLIPDYYKAFLDMYEFETDNPRYVNAPDKYARTFNAMVRAVLREAKQVSKKLKLPNLAGVIEEFYSK